MSMLLPLYLAGLLGLAVPWVLHRFNNTNPEEKAFPTVQFLEPARPPASRTRRMRYRMLFALRVLALTVLCLLFAEPVIERFLDSNKASVLQLIAVDRSLSMQAGERWQRAEAAVRETIENRGENDALQLLAFGSELSLLTETTLDAAKIHEAMASLEAGQTHADYGVLMQHLDSLAAKSDLPLSVTIISDAQRSSLPGRLNAMVATRLQSLSFVDTSSANDINYSLAADVRTTDDVNARISLVVASSQAIRTADSNSENTFESVRKTVAVSLAGRVVARETFELTPGQRLTRVLDPIALPVNNETVFNLAFVETDSLPLDDAVKSNVRTVNPLLFAIGSFAGPVNDNARVFVNTALETNGKAEVDDSGNAMARLAGDIRHAVVFAPMNEKISIPLEVTKFLDAGGNVLMILDAGSSTDTNAMPEMTGLVDNTHPLALGDIDWAGTRFHGLSAMPLEETDKVLVETSNHIPVLVERATPYGILLLLNDGLDGERSNLPFQPAFVTLMQNLLQYFDATNSVPQEVVAGVQVNLPANIQVLDPDGNPMFALADTGAARSLVFERPGLHTVVAAHGEEFMSVVTDPRESDLSLLDIKEIKAWEQRSFLNGDGSSMADIVAKHPASNTSTSTRQQGKSNASSLWRWLLPLLVLLMITESFFANRKLLVRRDGA
ncbi:MAG: BatA and WFA domain-containing protein [Granulosicoccus sp.]